MQSFFRKEVNLLNHALEHHKVASSTMLCVVEFGGIFVFYKLIAALSIPISSNFILAYGISRVLRKFRVPLELVLTKALIARVPALGDIHLSSLMAVQSPDRSKMNNR